MASAPVACGKRRYADSSQSNGRQQLQLALVSFHFNEANNGDFNWLLKFLEQKNPLVVCKRFENGRRGSFLIGLVGSVAQ